MRMSSLSELIPHVHAELPDPDDGIVLFQLRKAVRLFCQDSRVWTEELQPIAPLPYSSRHVPFLPANTELIHVHGCAMNGYRLEPCDYSWQKDYLILKTGSIPGVNSPNLLLTTGTVTNTTIANWQLAEAAFSLTLNGTYEISLDLSNVTSMVEIADALEQVMRLTVQRPGLFVRWWPATSVFTLMSVDSEPGYLTAPTAGTDISGAGFLNARNGAGKLSGFIGMTGVLAPHDQITTIPAELMERWRDAYVHKALNLLYTSKPWQDKVQADYHQGHYRTLLGRAKKAAWTGNTNQSVSITPA